jgi:hypothetical protein
MGLNLWLSATATLLVASVSSLSTQAGTISFEASQYFAVGGQPIAVAAGDFDRDGVDDIVTANYGSSGISVLLSNGDGTFQDARSSGTGGTSHDMAVGDFNGDGRLDVAVLDDHGVSLYPGNGDGTFQPGVVTSAAGNSMVAADFDRDGRLDLALGTSAGVSVLPGNGDGTFQPAQSAPGGALDYGPRFVAAGDFNHDGVLDLATADMASNNVSIYLRDGDGTFHPAATFSVIGYPGPTTGPWALAVGDFNGDGNLDLATANFGAGSAPHGSVSLLIGTGYGTFLPARNQPTAGRPSCLAVGDLDGDGIQDLMVTSRDSDNPPRPGTYVSAWLGSRYGTFTPRSMVNIESAGAVALGDFNARGMLDVVIANGGSVSVAQGNGNGTFRATPSYPLNRRAESVAVGDFDGDGRSDVVATDVQLRIAVLMGNGDGTLRRASAFADLGRHGSIVTTGDFNRDGRLDLAVADSGPDDQVVVLLGNGDGTFQPALRSVAGANPQSLVAGDFNGDGWPDLAVANNGSNTVSVLLGNGDGTFLTAMNFAVGSQPRSVAAGDLNGDGRLDLAVANNGSNTVSVLLGGGDGTFVAAMDFGVGIQPSSVVIGDFNGDGRADLAVANSGSGDVSVLVGNGDGTFLPARAFAAEPFASSIAIGDFDSDGAQDLVVGGILASVTILQGNGDGSFRTAQHFGAGAAPGSVAVGDFDGDGRLDVVTANLNSNDISMLLQRHAPGGGPDFAPTPVLDPNGGTFDSPVQVTMTGALPWGTIQYTLDASTPTDSSTLYAGPITLTETTTIRAISTGAHFAPSKVATATFTIRPATTNRPPIARAGVDQVMEATDAVGAFVTLDGSASSDPDGDPLTFNWSWSSGGAIGVRPIAEFPLGGTIVTLLVADTRGATGTVGVQITVQDTTPPALLLPALLSANSTIPRGAVLTYAVFATDLHAGAVTPACSPASGSTFPSNPRGEVTQVNCTADDGQRNIAQGSFPVHVAGAKEQVEDVATLIDALHLSKGLGSNLEGRLLDALGEITAGRPERACRKLTDFAVKVRVVSRKNRPEISSTQAESLLRSAQRIRAVLGCG